MKQITIAGRVGKDAELRKTQDGTPVIGFPVAVSGIGRDSAPTWFDVSLFGKRADALAAYVTKGTPITVSGDLSTRDHNGKTFLQIRASEVTLQGSRRSDEPRASETSRSAEAPRGDHGEIDDEIPF